MNSYDSVRWDFLLSILQIVGFPSCMVNWICESVSITRFSVSINGELNAFFACFRWVKTRRSSDTIQLCDMTQVRSDSNFDVKFSTVQFYAIEHNFQEWQ
jgi:hypothetical protein